MYIRIVAVVGAIFAASVPSARASTYTFALSGDYTATWQAPSNPTPATDDGTIPFGFAIDNVAGTYAGTAGSARDIRFFTTTDSGGFAIFQTVVTKVASGTGPQLFSGTITNPMFIPGIYTLNDQAIETGTFALVITDPATGVPEPGTLAIMLTAIGMVAGTARRRARS